MRDSNDVAIDGAMLRDRVLSQTRTNLSSFPGSFQFDAVKRVDGDAPIARHTQGIAKWRTTC